MDLVFRGPDHSDLAIDYYNYGKILSAMEDNAGALQYYQKSRDIEEKCRNEERVREIDRRIEKLR